MTNPTANLAQPRSNPGSVSVAIIGAGNIAGPYAKTLAASPLTTLLGISDLARDKAEALAGEVGCDTYPSLEALLADPAVEMVANLTIHTAHYAVIKQCLEAGKHVYSEKPMALTTAEAQELVTLAHERGVRLACSPFTFLGEAQQTAWKMIRDGALGTVRLAYAEVNHGRIESWHPAPAPFYEVGVLFDVGVYPLTMLTSFFGPAREVLAYSKLLYPDRVTKEGVPFSFKTPDLVIALIELENGTVVRLTTNFYVGSNRKQTGIEFHGDVGSLHLGSWQNPDAPVSFGTFGQAYQEVPLLKESHGMQWGLGVLELAEAILGDRPSRVTGEQAAHVVEILNAIVQSMQDNRRVRVGSSFTPPTPFDWAQ